MDKRIIIVIVAIVVIAVVGVWCLMNVRVGPRIPEGDVKAVSVLNCNTNTNTLTVMGVGGKNIEHTDEFVIYSLESGNPTGLSGFLEETLYPGEEASIQFFGGSLEVGGEYFVRAPWMADAPFTC